MILTFLGRKPHQNIKTLESRESLRLRHRNLTVKRVTLLNLKKMRYFLLSLTEKLD